MAKRGGSALSSSDGFRILIADDNYLNRRVLVELLKKRGYPVHAVNDGIEVIQALESGDYDLLILDCLMPGMDGYAVSRTIRAADRSRMDPDIHILALTALASEGAREKCLQAGMDHYICKPLQAETLFRYVEALVQNKAAGLRGRSPERGEEQAAHSRGTFEVADTGGFASELLQSMSGRIGRDIVQWQAELKAKMKCEAFDDIRLLAHKIRGTADLLEWRELSKRSERLERAAENSRGPELAACVSEVLESLGRCLKMVAALE